VGMAEGEGEVVGGVVMGMGDGAWGIGGGEDGGVGIKWYGYWRIRLIQHTRGFFDPRRTVLIVSVFAEGFFWFSYLHGTGYGKIGRVGF